MVGRQEEMGQIDEQIRPRRTPAQKLAWGTIAASLILLTSALTVPLWLPTMARTLIPDRYLVAYAPEPLKEIIFNSDSPRMLPTPASGQGGSAEALLQSTRSATPTAQTTLGGGDGYNDGAFVEPSALPDLSGSTPTPAFVLEQDLTPTASPIPASYFLGRNFTYTAQGWNKCGPSTLVMDLSFWGIVVTQNDVSNATKPHPEDSNVSPGELAGYVHSLGYGATYRENGNVELLKELIAAGYPVMIERGFDELPDSGWMGHYMLLIGFDDGAREFQVLDSYWGRNRVHEDQTFPVEHWDYLEFDRLWRHFIRSYLVVYPPQDQERITDMIGADVDDQSMWLGALQRTQDELKANPDDPFGWHNLGSILVELHEYESAAQAFDQARSTGKLPWRMLWYQFGMYEAYLQTGRLDMVMTLANNILRVDNYPESEEGFYYRGRVYELQGDFRLARREFNKALEYNPYFEPAIEALKRIGSN